MSHQARRRAAPLVTLLSNWALVGFTICVMWGSPSRAAQIVWEDEICENTITYDASRVDEEALRNTVNLLFGRSEIRPPSTTVFLFSPQEAARADLAKLEAECTEIQRLGRTLKLLPLRGIEEYRAFLLDDAQDLCEKTATTIRGLKDPTALRGYKPALAACSTYIDALEGRIDFDRMWSETVEASCQRNAQPPACKKRHYDEAQKPDGPEWKRLLVMGFGWDNCAVRFIRVNALSQRRAAMRAMLEKQFKNQFKIVTSKCDYRATD
jgi:hypothetical protein